jgi:hypothetical protein
MFPIDHPLSEKGRVLFALACALVSGAILTLAVERVHDRGWEILIVVALPLLTMLATAYRVARTGTITERVAWLWLASWSAAFGYDAYKAWHHALGLVDPFSTLVFDAMWVFISAASLWRHKQKPFPEIEKIPGVRPVK